MKIKVYCWCSRAEAFLSIKLVSLANNLQRIHGNAGPTNKPIIIM